jgi:NAD(P)-dependent dehydrogenase (short-subunit alcohol dehydrogenase family)
MSNESVSKPARVVITGANGHLGRKVTGVFLEKGYQVLAVVSGKDQPNGLSMHPMLETVALDLRDEKAVREWAAASIAHYGQISGLLCLAGGFGMGDFQSTGIKELREQWDLNFQTAYSVSNPIFLHMLEKKSGRIVFVGARPALEPSQGKSMIAYSLSKALLFKLAEFMNAEAKGSNVTASVVVPSILDTEPNRKNMPKADPSAWVSLEAMAELLELIVSDKGSPLREMVLKIYNNA